MGRYAFFNSGIEYKFAFGIQDSYDIAKFGGIDTSTDDDGFSHAWGPEDAPRILSNLLILQNLHGYAAIPWDQFPRTPEGTLDLRYHIEKTMSSWTQISYRYILGCLIYHQLLYTPYLTARYEG